MSVPKPADILPAPDVPTPPEPPSPPQPPHISFGRGGLHVPRAPHGPRIHPAPAPHAPGNPANHPPPAKVIHIHQGTPPVVQPGVPSKAAQQRGTMHQTLGKRIATRLQGMPAKNQQTFQTLLRAHGRQHAAGYHQAGRAYLQQQLAQIRSNTQAQGQTKAQVSHTVSRTNAAVQQGRNAGQKFVRVDTQDFDEPSQGGPTPGAQP